MDHIKITTKGARRNCRHLFLYGLVSGHALRYNQKQDRLLRMDSMNRTTDDLLDALLSKQALPEYFEENDAELQWQPDAYPDRHFGLRRVRHLCAGGGTGFLQLLLLLCGGGPQSFCGRWGAIFLPLTCLISAPGVHWWSGFAIRSNILFTASASCSAGCCSAFL